MLMASSKVIASRSPPNSDLPRDSPTSSINIHSDQPPRGFASMNIDEIFRNIYPDSASFDSAGDGGAMNGKTVEEVWRDMVTGGGDAPMTLEAFLTKAGAVNEEDVGVPAPGCVQSVIGVEFGSGRGKRRAAAEEVPLDKATQQKQRRMIKNRESAARSRERKQAYTVEMEAQVTSLEEEHEMLLRQEAEMNRKRYKQLTCGICFENYPRDRMRAVACGHPFCVLCWQGYIRTSINDGPGCLNLRCPDPSCGAAVSHDMVNELASKDDEKKYIRFFLRSFIEDNRKSKREKEGKEMANATVIIAVLLLLFFAIPSAIASGDGAKRRLIDAEGSPDDLVWVVQLSDLHFSVHHPHRAQDFIDFVGPALSFIKPSLVLLTGDLTDGKSKDLLTMKQDEEEWIEYHKVMQDVIDRSGLDHKAFYDIRGNHDNFGVPATGGSLDFFSRYSINSQQRRSGKVHSVTIQTSKRKVLFVGFDSTMDSGLRGPTNLFGHPTDELLAEINSELLQWDSRSAQSVTKVSFGHFTLSFSAASKTGKTLKDVFIDRSLAVYICGHLHIKFGKNLKRHHHSSGRGQHSKQLLQLNGHRLDSENASSCRDTDARSDGFWEWEMGDWRRSRAMRVLAIDRGHISFVDVNFTSGVKKTIILPTYPLDSRFSSSSNYKCDPSAYGHIRALVFSSSPIISVEAKVYDTSSGSLIVVLDTPMKPLAGSRGDLYLAPWHVQAFEDPSPDRYVLQIEVTDFKGRTTTTELRPFSVTGVPSQFKWGWAEFFVLGCQWDSLYHPILWAIYSFALSVLLIPRALLFFSRRHYTYINFRTNKSFLNGILWISTELYSIPAVSFCMIGYLLYLALCPWLYGHALSEEGERAFMTYRGWVVSRFSFLEKMDFLGSPDVMVVVLPHLVFVVLPALVTITVLAAESSVHRDYLLSLSSKKKDGSDSRNKKYAPQNNSGKKSSEPKRSWIRRLFLVICLVIFWKHFKNCEALVKAYEMNPVIHFPLYSFTVPLLLVYSIWRTGRNMNTTST